MPKHSNPRTQRPQVRQASAFRTVNPAQAGASYARNAGAYHQAAKSATRGKKIAIAVVVSVLVVLLCGGTAFAMYMGHINNQLTRGDKSNEELMGIDDALGYGTSLDKPFYMLLIGSDKREGNEDMGARSDTNIVVRVDPQENRVTMVSIPRDTKVDIKGHGTQKFNAAYAFGGAASTIKQAEELLDVKISHYAEVNFSALASLVDAVGGVTVENESRIDNHKCDDGDGNHYIIEKGTQHLNGGEALTFARNRDYPDGDFTRQKHQRMVIEGIVDEVLDMPITSMPGVIEAAAKCVTTDLGVFDLIGLAQMFADAGDLTIYSAMLPSYTQNINGISFVINDEEKTAEMMKLVEAGEDPSEIVSTMTAADITSSTIDTSNVIVWEDDEEYGSVNSKPTSGSGSKPSGTTGSTGGSTGGSSGNTNGSSNGGGSASEPETPSGGGTTTEPDAPTGGGGTTAGGGTTESSLE
ncbi:LCP family protein [Adlercreutzia murintestinalis]|uniref:LCP family protein n=1 Tax=Adlercreutzia murintestinalis TaxID=2941325 RepID=UPI002041E605|nr:LCP family protein [Adlercreutzia murintestinalis]